MARKWDRDFALLEAAAVAGERCPCSHPHGALSAGAVSGLVECGMIRSEVYAQNYRVITILSGPHAGKTTAPYPKIGAPYLINGKSLRGARTHMNGTVIRS